MSTATGPQLTSLRQHLVPACSFLKRKFESINHRKLETIYLDSFLPCALHLIPAPCPCTCHNSRDVALVTPTLWAWHSRTFTTSPSSRTGAIRVNCVHLMCSLKPKLPSIRDELLLICAHSNLGTTRGTQEMHNKLLLNRKYSEVDRKTI